MNDRELRVEAQRAARHAALHRALSTSLREARVNVAGHVRTSPTGKVVHVDHYVKQMDLVKLLKDLSNPRTKSRKVVVDTAGKNPNIEVKPLDSGFEVKRGNEKRTMSTPMAAGHHIRGEANALARPNEGVTGKSPARSASGNLRNFRSMSDEKLTALGQDMIGSTDAAGLESVMDELQRRGMGTRSTSTANLAQVRGNPDDAYKGSGNHKGGKRRSLVQQRADRLAARDVAAALQRQTFTPPPLETPSGNITKHRLEKALDLWDEYGEDSPEGWAIARQLSTLKYDQLDQLDREDLEALRDWTDMADPTNAQERQVALKLGGLVDEVLYGGWRAADAPGAPGRR